VLDRKTEVVQLLVRLCRSARRTSSRKITTAAGQTPANRARRGEALYAPVARSAARPRLPRRGAPTSAKLAVTSDLQIQSDADLGGSARFVRPLFTRPMSSWPDTSVGLSPETRMSRRFPGVTMNIGIPPAPR